MAKGDGLGIPKPAMKSLIDAFKTITETFNDILVAANNEDEVDAAHAASSRPGNGHAKSVGNGPDTVPPPSRGRRPTATGARR